MPRISDRELRRGYIQVLPKQIRIVEPLEFSPAAVRILETAGEVELRACRREELRDVFADYDVVWMRLGHRIDEALLGPGPRCRILAAPVTGLDHIDLAACERRGIRVVSLRGEVDFLREVRGTAELTVGLAIALMRHIAPAAASVRQGNWNRDLFRGNELFGGTVGIVGMGRLGTLAAGYLRAFGMTVLGYDPRDDFPFEAAERVASLHELLRRANLVILLVRYDSSTRHMIGAREFAAMRPGAVLVNTSRGGVVDEEALLAAEFGISRRRGPRRAGWRTGYRSGPSTDCVRSASRQSADRSAYRREHARIGGKNRGVFGPQSGGSDWIILLADANIRNHSGACRLETSG